MRIKNGRVINKSKSFKDAEQWDIIQHIRMRPEERKEAAARLRERVYGTDVPDVREAQKRKTNNE